MYHRSIPYHKVVAARLQRSKERRAATTANRYTEIDRFMLQYEMAYKQYHGIAITISYKHGWYYIAGYKYRHHNVLEMTNVLLAKVQEQQAPEPIEGDDDV